MASDKKVISLEVFASFMNDLKEKLLGKSNVGHIHDDVKGASGLTDGVAGFVPAPTAGQTNSYLKSDGKWTDIDNALSETSSNLVSNSVVSKEINLLKPNRKTIYLNGSSGDDTNDGLTSDNPMKTFSGALNKYKDCEFLKFSLNQTNTFSAVNVTIEGKDIEIEGNNAALKGNLFIKNCVFSASKVRFIGTAAYNIILSVSSSFVDISKSQFYLGSSENDQATSYFYGDNSQCYFEKNIFHDAGSLVSINGSDVSVYNCLGNKSKLLSVVARTTSKISLSNFLVSSSAISFNDDDITSGTPNYSTSNGGLIYLDGVQVAPDLLTNLFKRKTIYVDKTNGADTNSGLLTSVPMKTIDAALNKYKPYQNLAISLAAGNYTLTSTVSLERQRLSITGADRSTTTITGKFSLVNADLSTSNIKLIGAEEDTSQIVNLSSNSSLYCYHTDFSTSATQVEAIRATINSNAYLDGAVFTLGEATTNAVRSSGASVIGLGYCTIPGQIIASSSGQILITSGTITTTKVETGGIIYKDGTKI